MRPLPPDYRERLLEHLARNPQGLTTAHEALGWKQRTLYWRLERDPELRAALDDAQALVRKALEGGAILDWARRKGAQRTSGDRRRTPRRR